MLSLRAACILSLLFVSAASIHADTKRPPNIVFILADDLGWTDLGCQGSKYYETPNIDRLAREGMRFTDAYSAGPNCAPTRACLMTGRYTPRHGIYTVSTGERGNAKFRRLSPAENRTQLPLEEATVAQALKMLGYVTGMFGKWHLGNGPDYHPARRGFDQAIVSMGAHFNFKTQPAVKSNKDEYLADFLTDQAVQFISQNKDRPFFLYLPHFGVHSPFEAKNELTARFTKKTGVDGHNDPVYAAMIASVDESVGRILDTLDRLNLAEDTIVIFSSDNGGVGGYAAAGVPGAREVTANFPLRGGKGMLYEGGVRVPYIVRWKGTTSPGSRCQEAIISVDMYPTFVDLAGGTVNKKLTIDGTSLAPLFKGDGNARLQRDAIYWHFPGYLEGNVKTGSWRTTPCGSIRSGDFKLIEFFEDNRVELYNLRDDVSQKTDLAAAMPDRARDLRDRLHAWRKNVRAPMPTPRQ